MALMLELTRAGDTWKISLDGKVLDASAMEVAPNTFSILLNGESYQIRIAPRSDGTLLRLWPTAHAGCMSKRP